MNELQPQEISIDVFLEKYAKDGETSIDQNRRRVAKALASVEHESVRDEYEQLG
jgi:ribonucleoside-diphosphate reductase alpha chain